MVSKREACTGAVPAVLAGRWGAVGVSPQPRMLDLAGLCSRVTRVQVGGVRLIAF